MKYLIFIICIVFSSSAASNIDDNMSFKQLGLGVSLVFPFGDFSDFFKENLGYSLDMRTKSESYKDIFWSGGLKYSPMVSDDVKVASKAHLYSANFGADLEIYRTSWYSFLFGIRPEFTYWYIKNKMSENYDSYDKGGFVSLIAGVKNSFHFDSFSLELFVDGHFPKINVTTSYLEVGLSLAKRI